MRTPQLYIKSDLLWVERKRLDLDSIDAERFYEGALIQEAVAEDRQLSVDLIAAVTRLKGQISFIAGGCTCGSGAALREGLQGMDEELSASFTGLAKVVRRHKGEMPPDEMAMVSALIQAVIDVLNGEQGSEAGLRELVKKCDKSLLPRLDQFAQRLRESHRATGATDPALDTLYRLALPFYRQTPTQWSGIAAALWNSINRTPEGERSGDQRALFNLWRYMSHRARKDQLRDLWRKRGK